MPVKGLTGSLIGKGFDENGSASWFLFSSLSFIKPYLYDELLAMIDKTREEALRVLEETTRYGAQARETALEYLPSDLSYIVPQIRQAFINFSERYRKSRSVSLIDLVSDYDNIPRSELLLRYLVLSSSVSATIERPKYSLIYSAMRDMYGDLMPFLEEPTWKRARKFTLIISDRVGASRDDLGTALSNFAVSMNRLVKSTLVKRVALIGRYRDLKDFLRNFMPDKASLHRTKTLSLLTRIIGHETNVPFAGKIIIRKENLKYDPVVDMYTAIVALRSGAFLAVDNERTRLMMIRLRQGVTSYKMRKVVPIVRDTVKAARDSMLYEKGASDIGRNYCSKLECDKCPIRHVCKRFTNIEVK